MGTYRLSPFASRGKAGVKSVSAAVLLVCCGSCVSGREESSQQAPAPIFDPVAFFVPPTHGQAVLKIAFHRPVSVSVEGQGRLDASGTLVLDQSVRSGTDPVKRRTWRLHRTGPGYWAGTLSDAAGPVGGQVEGSCFHLAFTLKGGLKAQQWLYLQPGGNTVHNVMVVRKFGVPVARLDETIVRNPGFGS